MSDSKAAVQTPVKYEQTTKLTARDVFRIDAKEIPYEKYISNRNEELFKRILTDDQNYNLIAEMGGGKTYSIIRSAITFDVKIILIVPLRAILFQLKNEYKNSNIAFLFGKDEATKGITAEQIIEQIKSHQSKIIICTYDSLYKLYNNNEINLNEFLLVIDEMHILLTHYQYRFTAIQKIISGLKNFRKIITLTGTPGLASISPGYSNIQFNKTDSTLNTDRTPLIIIRNNSQINQLLISQLQLRNYPGFIVIFQNDKNKNEALKIMLEKISLSDNRTSDNRIITLSRETTDSPVFKKIRDANMIPDEVKILISTSIISEGLNIKNKNISAVFCLNITDFWSKRQFISRFRNGVGEVVDFMPVAEERKRNWEIPSNIFSEIHNKAISLRDEINSMNSTKKKYEPKKKTYINTKDIQLVKNGILYYDENNEAVISHEAIGYVVVQYFNSLMYEDVNKALEFYNDIAGFDATTKSINDDQSISSIVDANFDVAKSLKENSSDWIVDNLNDIITTTIEKSSEIKILPSRFDTRLLGKNVDSTKKYQALMKNRTSNKIVKDLSVIVLEGFPKEIVEIIAQHKLQGSHKGNEIYWVVKFNCIMSTVKFFNHKLIDLARDEKIFSLYLFIYELLQELDGKSEFIYNNLKNKMNRYCVNHNLNLKQTTNIHFDNLFMYSLMGTINYNKPKGGKDRKRVRFNGLVYLETILDSYGILSREINFPFSQDYKLLEYHLFAADISKYLENAKTLKISHATVSQLEMFLKFSSNPSEGLGILTDLFADESL